MEAGLSEPLSVFAGPASSPEQPTLGRAQHKGSKSGHTKSCCKCSLKVKEERRVGCRSSL